VEAEVRPAPHNQDQTQMTIFKTLLLAAAALSICGAAKAEDLVCRIHDIAGNDLTYAPTVTSDNVRL
jgi:hypothetical protein